MTAIKDRKEKREQDQKKPDYSASGEDRNPLVMRQYVGVFVILLEEVFLHRPPEITRAYPSKQIIRR